MGEQAMSLQEKTFEERCRRATDIYLLVMLLVFPLFTGISGYMYLHMKKFLLFAGVTIIWFGYLCVEAVRHSRNGGQLLRLGVQELCVIFFLAAATLSTLHSPFRVVLSMEGRYDGLVTYLLYGAIFLGVSRFGVLSDRYLYAAAVSYTICCVIAGLQLLGWNVLWLYPNGMNFYEPIVQETGVFLGTVGNADVLSAFHCLMLPLLLAELLLGGKRRRFLLCIPVVLGVVCQVGAGVASGLLSLALTLLLFAPGACVVIWQERVGGQKGRFLSYIGLVPLLFGPIILYLYPGLTGTAYEVQRVLHGDLRDEFGSHRILIWRKVLEVIKEHPILGVGPESLWYYLDIQFERYSSILNEMLYSGVDNAHNEYLQLLVTFGLLGSFPLLVLLVKLLQRVFRSRGTVLYYYLAPCLFCYLFQALFNIGMCIITPLFCILCGLICTNGVDEVQHSLNVYDSRKE